MNACVACLSRLFAFFVQSTDPLALSGSLGRSAKKLIFPLAFPVNCLGFRKLFKDYNIDYSFSMFTTEEEGRGSSAAVD